MELDDIIEDNASACNFEKEAELLKEEFFASSIKSRQEADEQEMKDVDHTMFVL